MTDLNRKLQYHWKVVGNFIIWDLKTFNFNLRRNKSKIREMLYVVIPF